MRLPLERVTTPSDTAQCGPTDGLCTPSASVSPGPARMRSTKHARSRSVDLCILETVRGAAAAAERTRANLCAENNQDISKQDRESIHGRTDDGNNGSAVWALPVRRESAAVTGQGRESFTSQYDDGSDGGDLVLPVRRESAAVVGVHFPNEADVRGGVDNGPSSSIQTSATATHAHGIGDKASTPTAGHKRGHVRSMSATYARGDALVVSGWFKNGNTQKNTEGPRDANSGSDSDAGTITTSATAGNKHTANANDSRVTVSAARVRSPPTPHLVPTVFQRRFSAVVPSPRSSSASSSQVGHQSQTPASVASSMPGTESSQSSDAAVATKNDRGGVDTSALPPTTVRVVFPPFIVVDTQSFKTRDVFTVGKSAYPSESIPRFCPFGLSAK